MTQPLVYIIDDHAAVCEALSEMLNVFGYQVRTFQTAQAFFDAAEPDQPGCIVSDVRMPGLDGLQLLAEVKKRAWRLPVVLISGQADVPLAVAAIKAGAEDLIEKPVDDKKLVAAINRCLARVMTDLVDQQSEADLTRRFGLLTPREIEVLDLVVQGCTSQAVAMRLGISTRTVESYRVQIMDKMQAASIAVLVRQAIRLGRLTP